MYLRSLTGASQTTPPTVVCGGDERAARNLPILPRSKGHFVSLRGEKRLYVFNYTTLHLGPAHKLIIRLCPLPMDAVTQD